MAEFREVLLSTESALSPPPAAVVSELAVSAIRRAGVAGVQLSPPGRGRRAASAFAPRWSRVVVAARWRRRRRSRSLALFVVASSGMRGQATRLLARTAGAQETRHRAGELRLAIRRGPSSSRSDGAVLGVTPLSVEIPYSDAPVEYRLYKEGYASKVSSFVPNLPSPVFVLLERIDPPAPSVAEASAARRSGGRASAARPVAGAPSPARARASRGRAVTVSRPSGSHDLVDDGDDVMPPSTQ